MIIFLDEERSYLSWVTHHRHGFVIDGKRVGQRLRPTVHRASCESVRKKAKARVTHFTTGRNLKACAEDLLELTNWLEQQLQKPRFCEFCKPLDVGKGDDSAESRQRQLSKFGHELLDYVIEIAVISMDNPESEYALTVGNLSQIFDKSVGQLKATLNTLIQGGWIHLLSVTEKADLLVNDTLVFPTADALRTEAAFAELSDKQANEQLRLLYPVWPRM